MKAGDISNSIVEVLLNLEIILLNYMTVTLSDFIIDVLVTSHR